MKHNYILKTKRLLFRQLTTEDLENVLEWRNNRIINKWFFNSEAISMEQQQAWYESYLNKDREIMFLIEETSEINEPIGVLGLLDIDEEKQTVEIGRLMIGNFKARGKAIGLESMVVVCGFAFSEFNVNKIYAKVYETNRSCLKICKEMGFRITDTEINEAGEKIFSIELDSKTWDLYKQ